MRKPSKTVAEYIGTFPKETQAVLKKVRETIRKAAPGAEESISYGLVGYKLNGKPLVYFGGWKSHVGFYATPAGNAAFKKELAPYGQAKGSIRFPLDEPVPLGLIRRMVRFRVKETKAAQKTRG